MSERHHGEERFRTVARTLTEAVLVLDESGSILYANDEVEVMFGHPPASVIGRPAGSLLATEDREAQRGALQRLAAETGPGAERIEIAAMHRDGRRVPVEVTYGTYRKGEDRFYTAILRDISERRRTESRLRFQARLLDAVGEAVIATDPAGRILYWNAAAEQLYGWPADEVMGRPIEDVTPTSMSRPKALEIMDRLRNGESWTGEFRAHDRAGREFPIAVTDSPVHDDDGTLVAIIGTSREITGRKRTEESQRFLAEAGRVLASSLDHATTLSHVSRLAVPMLGDWCMVHLLDDRRAPAPVAHCTPDGLESRADELQDALTGPDGVLACVLPVTESVSLTVGAEQVPPDARLRLEGLGIAELLVVPLASRGEQLGMMTFARPTGARPYDDEDRRLAGELGLRSAAALDNARLYQEAEESDRAKTDFLAVVSHELRTPLNAITGYAELLTGGVSGPLNDKQLTQIERISISARHLAQLIDEILTYSRMEGGRDTLELEPTDVAQLVRETVSVLQQTARAKGLELSMSTPNPGPELPTDPGKLRQIVVNLVSNALKYTEEGEVRVDLRELEHGIEIEIADTGIGIPEEEQERIFEPFRQVQAPNTRTVGGTGLGLSVSRRLAHLMGGTIDLASTPDVGSTFTVRLPARPPDRF